MTHPDLPGSLCEVAESAYRRVWAPRGWQPADPPADPEPDPAPEPSPVPSDQPTPARQRKSKES